MNNSCRIAHFTDLHWLQAIPGTSGIVKRHSRLMPDVFADALSKIQTKAVDLIVVTGDLVDVPFPFGSVERDLVVAEYVAMKALLDGAGIPYVVLPGNHDDPDCFFSVFDRVEKLDLGGYEFHCFFDHQDGGDPIYRKNDELVRFNTLITEPGARNHIHLQHYLIHPEKNDGFPHTYAHAADFKQAIAASERVLLSVSGHYHPGHELEKLAHTFYLVGRSFSENPYPYVLIELQGEEVSVVAEDMSDEVRKSPLESSYREHAATGDWHSGNLHMHCSENSPCSVIPLDTGVQQYVDKQRHSFFALTDHDVIAALAPLKKAYPDKIFYEGFEHSVSNHMLFIAEKVAPLFKTRDKREALQQAQEKTEDYLTIICHPQGPKIDYWTVDELLTYPVLPNGAEVFNGHYGVGAWRQKGFGWEYTQFWSDCLDAGLRLHAYANDDYHDGDVDLMNGWNVVLAPAFTSAAVLDALRAGSCYATTGLSLKTIQEYCGRIVIVFDEPVEGRFIGPQREVLKSDKAQVFEYKLQDEAFIRFEAEANGRKLWTQPMYAVSVK